MKHIRLKALLIASWQGGGVRMLSVVVVLNVMHVSFSPFYTKSLLRMVM